MNYVIVTGGSGFIGSAVVNDLLTFGYNVLVVDRKINSWTKMLSQTYSNFRYIETDVSRLDMHNILQSTGSYNIHAIIHLAANHVVPESVKNPLKFYKNNLSSLMNMLELYNNFSNQKTKPHFIYSSSAAVYAKSHLPIKETYQLDPINPYGQTKLWGEQMIQSTSVAENFKYACLRYFNVAGSGLRHGYNAEVATHAVPILVRSILKNETFPIFGNDYSTKDGTCVRDYLHVRDVSIAHVLALKYLEKNNDSIVANLGTRIGISMLDLIEAAAIILNKEIKFELNYRRLGDPPMLVADPSLAESKFNWKPNYTLEDIIRDSWEWELQKTIVEAV